jgi:Spy/CpxP family protein refolding chaperone
MRKITMTLAVAAFAIGATALSAQAQTQASGAAHLNAQAQNATIIHEAACHGWGAHCPPGRTWTCNGYGRCWCRPCW